MLNLASSKLTALNIFSVDLSVLQLLFSLAVDPQTVSMRIEPEAGLVGRTD